ncbi:MAG: radical SAM protein, partial [Bacteroidota bacterium]
MKIGLIFPNKDRKDKAVHLGLGYLASYARSRHDEIEIIILDTRTATKKETRRFFASTFDLIGITVLSPVYYEVISLFKTIRKANCTKSICLGGPYVTTLMEEIFVQTPADYAVYGEGEITFSELLFFIKGQRNLEEINGLMYRDLSGEIKTNAPRELITDLDSLPLPAYDLFKMNRYPVHRLVTSRGCPYRCAFCNSTSIWQFTWRKRSAENVVAEIEFLTRQFGNKTFSFNDNSFNIDMDRVDQFCDLLIEKETKILWSTPVRAEKINLPLARKMKKAGCYNVGVGIESANDAILKMMDKQNSIVKIEEGISIFKKAGIEVLGQFVIGSPGETLEKVK